MFDLNLSIGCNGEGEISPVAWDSRASLSSGSGLVTRELFPVSRVDEPGRPDGPVQSRKSRRGPRSRSSQYRGVTFYRRTGRWESHIWDCGKQVYLGGFDTALAAARAYDRAAIKFRGVEADINFNLGDYDDMKQMMNLSKEEFVQLLRRQSNGFWRGGCKYRGGGGLPGNKAYNKASIMCNGSEAAVTNFESCTYNGAPNEGSHNLDLNLGTPDVRNSAALKVKGNSGNMERLISHQPLEGLPVTLEHPNLWTALIPNDCPNYDEEKAGIVASPQVLAKWAWRMQSSTPDETSSSSSPSAASSGFSSMANSNASSPLPLFYSTQHPNTSTNDTSQYLSWLMPPS